MLIFVLLLLAPERLMASPTFRLERVETTPGLTEAQVRAVLESALAQAVYARTTDDRSREKPAPLVSIPEGADDRVRITIGIMNGEGAGVAEAKDIRVQSVFADREPIEDLKLKFPAILVDRVDVVVHGRFSTTVKERQEIVDLRKRQAQELCSDFDRAKPGSEDAAHSRAIEIWMNRPGRERMLQSLLHAIGAPFEDKRIVVRSLEDGLAELGVVFSCSSTTWKRLEQGANEQQKRDRRLP